MRNRRFVSVFVFGVAALLLGGASLAWACTASASINTSPPAGRAGSQVTVTGQEWLADRPVEIRWNTASGKILAATTTDSRGDFTAKITIPEVPEDTYTIVGVTRDQARNVWTASTSFVVNDGSEPAKSQTERDTDARQTSNPPARGPVDSQGSGADQRANAPADSSARTPSGTRDGSSSSAPAASARSGLVATDSGEAVFAPSVSAPAGSAATVGAREAKTGGSVSAGTPSERTASSDVASGFGSADSSLVPSLGDAVPAEGPGSQLALGLGLLGVGLVALLGGFLVAELRRRRAPAHAPNPGERS